MKIAHNVGGRFACMVALAALTTALGAQQDGTRPPGWDDNSQPAPERPGAITFRTGVQLVLQDITVFDANGHPVTGLKPEDFHIFEDGKPQTIKNFEEHVPIDPALAEERQAELASKLPPNTFTNYKAFSGGTLVVFLIDTVDQVGCGLGATTEMHLRQDMIDYMKTVPLGTPYIIVQLDTRLHMVQDMTTDLDALRSAVYGKRDFPELPPQLGPDDPRYPASAVALRRRQILTGAMKDLKQYLGAIPGRKNLVWFLGLLGPSLQMNDTSSIPGPTQVSVNPLAVPTSSTSTSVVSTALDLSYSDPNSIPLLFGGVPVPEVKTQPTFNTYLGTLTESLAQSRIGLYIMQGHPIPFTNPTICDYPKGKERIAAIVDHGAHYYTLTYTPTNQDWNGRRRTFSVAMDDPTLHLEYRRNYLGGPNDTAVQRVVTPVETAAAAAVLHDAAGPSITMQTAMGMGTVEPTQVVFEASATPARVETKDSGNQPMVAGNYLNVKLRKQGYRDYLVHFRVHANELKLTPSADQTAYIGKLEFVAVVYDNLGQAVNGKREKASVSFPNLTDPQLQTADLTGDLTIQVPVKGSYFLRLGVHDVAIDRVGALEIPVDRIPMPGK